MNECEIKGCRHLQTTCVTCGKLVSTKLMPPFAEWICMRDLEPDEECEILIKSDCTDEKYGIAVPDRKLVILKRTDVKFSDIQYWMEIPEEPK